MQNAPLKKYIFLKNHQAWDLEGEDQLIRGLQIEILPWLLGSLAPWTLLKAITAP